VGIAFIGNVMDNAAVLPYLVLYYILILTLVGREGGREEGRQGMVCADVPLFSVPS